ncbi:hypothetical protein DICVIV_12842 [Dictyocaulus viviparus]|uniref:Uncharacterized protein n=1 Tax=Dictyocaulus viviparus TaxID=29172 RepID=A0A0D8X9F1_DICVI|nr:hypothetical protein DICVIV_12842 [Dictyocaulus viviparus]
MVRNRIAPGPDRIKPEFLKDLPPVLIKTMLVSSNVTCPSAKLKGRWKTSRTVLLHKNDSKDNEFEERK